MHEMGCKEIYIVGKTVHVLHYTGQALLVSGSLGDAVHIDDYFPADASWGVDVVAANVAVWGA